MINPLPQFETKGNTWPHNEIITSENVEPKEVENYIMIRLMRKYGRNNIIA